MAGVELDICSTVHEVSNQQSVKARSSPTQTTVHGFQTHQMPTAARKWHSEGQDLERLKLFCASQGINISWLGTLTWATPKATSIQVQRGSRTWNKFAPGEASQQSPSQKPLQPTLWECNWMIACTTMLPLMCRPLAWQKPLPLSAWAWLPSANCRLLFCSQNLMCYPWVSKCTDRSRWSLATVTSGHGRPSILGATAIVEHQP